MKKGNEKGTASIEAALGLVILVPLLMLVIEGTYALNEYSTLLDASREGARMVLRNEGDASQVEDLIKSLTGSLPGNSPTVEVTTDAAKETVTVQVEYEYEPHLFSVSEDNHYLDIALLKGDYKFTAATVMPMLSSNN